MLVRDTGILKLVLVFLVCKTWLVCELWFPVRSCGQQQREVLGGPAQRSNPWVIIFS